MKIYLLSILLIQFSLIYSQPKYDFRLKKSVEVNLNKTIYLNSDNSLTFKTDKRQFYSIMNYSNSRFRQNSKQSIDSVDLTPYVSRVHCFNSEINKDEIVVVWESEFENKSYISVYYLKDNQLMKIGELKISLSCPTCEYFGYPIKSINIQKDKNNIEFSFLEDLEYWISGDREIFFKAGTFKYQFDISQKKLKVIAKGV